MKSQNEWKRRAKTTEKTHRENKLSNNAIVTAYNAFFDKAQNKDFNKQQTLEQFFNPILKKNSDSLNKKIKSPNEKRFHDFIQPIMRFKPRLDLERIVDEVNKNNFGRADRSIVDKHLSKLDSNNLIVLNSSSESQNLDESMEHYLKYVNSQNRIAIMKMIENKTLDKIVKQFKKEERDQKIINDNFEINNKDGNTEGNNCQSKNKIFRESKNKNLIYQENKEIKSKKKNFIDKSCAKDILKELHTKTYFNATNIIAKDMKLTIIKENLKNTKNEENLNKKEFYNKNLKNFLSDKNIKPSQAHSVNDSFSSKPKQSQSKINNLMQTSDLKKNDLNFKANKNNKDSLNSHVTNTCDDQKINNNTNNYNINNEKKNNNSNKKTFNKTDNNFSRTNKINYASYQSKNNIVENVISKFKNTFSIEKDNENKEFDENPLLYNPNFNQLRKKQIQTEEFDSDKLDYLKKLALSHNKKHNSKRFNNLARHNNDRNSISKKAEKEGNLNDSDEDLLEIKNELKNSFNNHGNKNVNNNYSGNNNNDANLSFSNEKNFKQKINLRKNEIGKFNFLSSSKNTKGMYSPNGETVIKITDLAKNVVDKCNFNMKKHKNNNTKLSTGNGKLMITSGLSVRDFMEKFNLK